MYSLNGVPLDNPTFGWLFRAPSKPLSEISRRVGANRVPGRHGIVTAPATLAPPTLSLMIQTSNGSAREALNALITQPVLTLTQTHLPGRVAVVELLGATLDGFGAADAVLDVTVLVRINGVFWRDSEAKPFPPLPSIGLPLTGASHTIGAFDGLSAPVPDAHLEVEGPVTGLRVEDSGGSWLTLSGALVADELLVVDTAAGTAVTVLNGIETDASGRLDFGGSQSGMFQIAPAFPVPSDPSIRQGQVAFKTATRSAGATARITGRGAYLV